MIQEELFKKNEAGRVVGLESFMNVFPGRENAFRILFGGEVLERMDELSGSLANMYVGTEGRVSVHVSEFVVFARALHAGESGNIIAKVALVTDRLISVYMEVWGGSMTRPDEFTLRYAGFGNCAVLDAQGAMRKDLEPYRGPEEIAALAEEVLPFQKRLRDAVLKLHAEASR